MKSIREILETPAVFLGEFDDIKSVIENFETVYNSSDLEEFLNRDYKDINIILATYEVDGYDGYAYVLFERNGNLYEAHGSHCSCYGLEDQWSPDEVNIKELEHRLLEGTFGESSYSGNFKKELCEKLGIEYKKNRGNY